MASGGRGKRSGKEKKGPKNVPVSNKKIEKKREKKFGKERALVASTSAPPVLPSAPYTSRNGSQIAKEVKKKDKDVEDKLSGFIFMCSGNTKPECYKHRVFGLPAGRMDVVENIKPGTKLFLFDFDLKLLYGIYKATSKGGRKLEPKAFGGKYPAQVRFKIFTDCLPLPESEFKHAIKDNYTSGSKFAPELNSRQVKKLIRMFRPISLASIGPPPPTVVPSQGRQPPVREDRYHPPARRQHVEDPYRTPPARLPPREDPYMAPPARLPPREDPFPPPARLAPREDPYLAPPTRLPPRDDPYGIPSARLPVHEDPYTLAPARLPVYESPYTLAPARLPPHEDPYALQRARLPLEDRYVVGTHHGRPPIVQESQNLPPIGLQSNLAPIYTVENLSLASQDPYGRYRTAPEMIHREQLHAREGEHHRLLLEREKGIVPHLERPDDYYNQMRGRVVTHFLAPPYGSAPALELHERQRGSYHTNVAPVDPIHAYADPLQRPAPGRIGVAGGNPPISSLYSFAGSAPAYR
ncbi:hypothetical protein Scep_018329 [Stephania cephalantha]|uniref:DCD domain-containing protein n=1 Tax=Stephania cephalantha TaxID=152367 RepID=A0AAP0NXU1_9MAGN